MLSCPYVLFCILQDPSYPVYVDTSVMVGQTGEVSEETMQYDNIVYMPCKPSNDFFPDLKVSGREITNYDEFRRNVEM